MKIGIISRSVDERWIVALTKTAFERGDEVHVIVETISAGKVAAAGGQTHLIEPARWGGAFGRWVFARRAKMEMLAEPLDKIISAGDVLDPDILLVGDVPGPGPGDKSLRRALKQGRFGTAAAAAVSVRDALVEQYGIDRSRIVVAGPPAQDAVEAEWENRARAFWSAIA